MFYIIIISVVNLDDDNAASSGRATTIYKPKYQGIKV